MKFRVRKPSTQILSHPMQSFTNTLQFLRKRTRSTPDPAIVIVMLTARLSATLLTAAATTTRTMMTTKFTQSLNWTITISHQFTPHYSSLLLILFCMVSRCIFH
ncbi:unnamed protein product [Kuraishia capsulata CBS 1993]|uniref:Uncharacterized protein n=1 Tax=Kuraishia capsulata CBS 1993 TaxID=1382522 RepID=W6MSX2_9ASCO|nr:uncharacterized protein KUCA_T00005915001 [Kuraishia capsulata CBS 1993]CDK29921.1 unnamed protein product [Kuraishia capsulata CBS 1993]